MVYAWLVWVCEDFAAAFVHAFSGHGGNDMLKMWCLVEDVCNFLAEVRKLEIYVTPWRSTVLRPSFSDCPLPSHSLKHVSRYLQLN
jgi:hypothetical protein